MAGMGTEATLGLRPISSVTLYRIAQYKIPLAFNALYFPYSGPVGAKLRFRDI